MPTDRDPKHAASTSEHDENCWIACPHDEPPVSSAAKRREHPCPKGDDCALNSGAVHCKHCGRNWPPDETWNAAIRRTPERMDDRLRWFRYIVHADPTKGLENDQARFLLERIDALELERDQLKEALRARI